MGSDIECPASGFGMRAHHRLRYGRHISALLLAELRETEPRARGEDRMLRDEAFELPFHLGSKRVVGRPQVGKFRVAADRRNGPRIEQRAQCRNALERTVRMPKTVRELKHPLPAVLLPHLIARIEVGYVGEFLGHAQLRLLDVEARNRGLKRAELAGEIEMLVLAQMLVGKNQ